MREKIISCQYSSETCDEDDFFFFQNSEFIKCYKFNSGKTFTGKSQNIRKARRYGKTYGLQLEIFVGLPTSCKSPLSIGTGLNFL